MCSNYILTAVIAFLGLIVGMFVSYCNLDELKPGRKYFVLLQKILFALFLFHVSLNIPFVLKIILVVLGIIPFFSKKQIPSPFTYFLIGVLFYLGSISKKSIVVNASLIFLFGIPSGTLAKITKTGKIKKGFVKEILKHLGFVVCLLPYIIYFL